VGGKSWEAVYRDKLYRELVSYVSIAMVGQLAVAVRQLPDLIRIQGCVRLGTSNDGWIDLMIVAGGSCEICL